jgi:serine phosphatase RsbU (regulator of sigma subunit)
VQDLDMREGGSTTVVSERSGRQQAVRRLLLYAAALLLPLAVAAVFDHPARRLLVPGVLMFVIVVVVTLVGGLGPGIVAAVAATASLWFFNTPPGLSFRFNSGDDAAAILLTGLISVGLVLLVVRLRRADRALAAAEVRSRLAAELQRQSISTMQRALLPQVVPPARGITIGSYYQTGSDDDAPVGGDWFAFIPLSPSSLGLAIGDVAGHGLHAVTSMAEYRYAMRVVATEHGEPAEVIEHFESVTAMYRRELFTSCIYGVVDGLHETFTFTNAGHPPPLLVRDGVARVLGSGPHGPVVGSDLGARYGSTTEPLVHDDFIVLYTDGLVERRGEHLDVGIDRLGRRVSTLTRVDLDAQCRQIVLDLLGTTSTDDAAIVVAHYDATFRQPDEESRGRSAEPPNVNPGAA